MKLLPCPFCGSATPAMIAPRKGSTTLFHHFVTCSDCWAQGPAGADEREAAERWNEADQRVRADLAEKESRDLAKLVTGLHENMERLRAQNDELKRGLAV